MSEQLYYLPFDCEMGGIGPTLSLLTVHFALCDKDFNIIKELDLTVKPDNGNYVVQAEGMAVNKINLIEHDKVAITYSAAGGKLREFLKLVSSNGENRPIPVGKGIEGDVRKINETILGEKAWNQFVSYRCYDITTLIILQKRLGKLPNDVPDSLEGLAEYFGISQEWHTAKGDCLASIEVVKRLEKL